MELCFGWDNLSHFARMPDKMALAYETCLPGDGGMSTVGDPLIPVGGKRSSAEKIRSRCLEGSRQAFPRLTVQTVTGDGGQPNELYAEGPFSHPSDSTEFNHKREGRLG